MVSMLAFYSDDSSSNPTDACNFYPVNFLKRTKNIRKEVADGLFKIKTQQRTYPNSLAVLPAIERRDSGEREKEDADAEVGQQEVDKQEAAGVHQVTCMSKLV